MTHRPQNFAAFRTWILVSSLCAATVLSVGSGRRRLPLGAMVTGSGPFRSEKDPGLGHPALLIINRTDRVVRIRFRGTMKRSIVVPPKGAFRTLTGAGAYGFRITCHPKKCPFRETKGLVRFYRGRRYILKLE